MEFQVISHLPSLLRDPKGDFILFYRGILEEMERKIRRNAKIIEVGSQKNCGELYN